MEQKMESSDDIQAPRDEWQTRARGALHDEYAIYHAAIVSVGGEPKPYDEWLHS